MNPGPLRRLVGTLGLVALVPVAWQLWTGALTPGAAASRAVVVFLVAVVVGRVVTRYLDNVVRSVEADIATAVRVERVAPVAGHGTAEGE